MPIYEFQNDKIVQLSKTTFSEVGLRERQDLQRLLRENIDIISPGTLVIAEEFSAWIDSNRRIDLLGIDKKANLVVIELKRTDDGGHMDLQAIRYAAMVSKFTFRKAIEEFSRYLKKINKAELNAEETLLNHLSWSKPEDGFAQDIKIVLASGSFDKEITTTVMWLREYEIDIRCVRLLPYNFNGKILVDVQELIPLQETKEYQVQLGEKVREERQTQSGKDYTKYKLTFLDKTDDGLSKGRCSLRLCQLLCGNEVDPSEIANTIERPIEKTWLSVEGSVISEDFVERFSDEAGGPDGGRFEMKRWFCNDGELIVFKKKTYALTSQWANPNWQVQTQKLVDKYGVRFGINVSAEI